MLLPVTLIEKGGFLLEAKALFFYHQHSWWFIHAKAYNKKEDCDVLLFNPLNEAYDKQTKMYSLSTYNIHFIIFLRFINTLELFLQFNSLI